MSTVPTKSLPAHNSTDRKNALTLNIFFFAVSAFIALASFQFNSVVPSWLNSISVGLGVIGCGMFIYGFILRASDQLKKRLGYFTAFFLVLISVQLFFLANTMYISDVEAGTILEQVNFLSASISEYLIIVAILSFFVYILSSPKLLFREVRSLKVYLWAITGGAVVVFLTFLVMVLVKSAIFVSPETVEAPYEFLMASVILGFGGISVFILILRSKKRGN